MNTRKEFIKHLANIFFSQNNEEYRNFLIGILRMQNFKSWDKILAECSQDYDGFTFPCMTYSWVKYIERIKEYCEHEFSMSGTDFERKWSWDWEGVEEYEQALPRDKTTMRQALKQRYIDTSWISENLDLVLSQELPDYTPEDIEIIKKRVLELQSLNKHTLKNIDFRILQNKYLKIFTKEQIAQIVSYPVIQEAILNLDDNELECFDVVVNDYIKREKILFEHDKEESQLEGSKPSQWAQMTEKYLVSLISGQYAEIITQIGQVEDENRRKELYTKLGYIMSDANVYEINTIDKLENYEEIRRDVCRRIVYDEELEGYPQLENMDEVSRKRFAIMQRYGISSGFELSKMFDDDISTVPVKENSSQETQIEYILAIKELYKIESPEEFRKIFELLEKAQVPYIPPQYSNQKILEKKIKLLYEKIYNQSLTPIEILEEISDKRRKQLGLDGYKGKVLEVGENFNLTVTSISPYMDRDREIENYPQDWKRKSLKSQLACFTNITEGRFLTATISNTLLGFDKVYGIDMYAPMDNFSEAKAMTPFCEANWFTLPGNKGIGRLNTVTEIDAKRTMPSYIPVKKRDGRLIQIENSKIAAKQFGEISDDGDELPLVIIDEDRLIYKKSVKILRLIQLYRTTPSKDLLRKIAGELGEDVEVIPDFYYEDLMKDLLKQDFSGVEKIASGCDLSQIVEQINNLPYAREIKQKVQIDSGETDVCEEILSIMYTGVPVSAKRSAFQTIRDALEQGYAKEEKEG